MQFAHTLLALLAICLGSASHAETESLRIATGDYVPFTDQTAPGGGIVNAHVEQIARKAGYAVEFDFMPWMRGLELTRLGRYSAASYWFYREEREADFIHVGPVVADRMVLFRRVDTQMPEWTQIQDLNAMILGAVTGYTYTPDFWDLAETGGLTVQTAQDDEANLRKLLAGRIDVYPMSERVGARLIEQMFTPEQRAELTFEAQPLLVTEGFLLISRQLDDAEEIAKRLQSVVDETGLATQSAGG